MDGYKIFAKVIEKLNIDNVLFVIGGLSFLISIYQKYELGIRISLIMIIFGIICNMLFGFFREIYQENIKHMMIFKKGNNILTFLLFIVYLSVIFLTLFFIVIINEILPFITK